MQTLANTTQLNSGALPIHDQDSDDQKLILKGLYRQLFKENRDFDFFHNSLLDSKYLNGDFTVRDLVREFICSDMYTNYILAMNSNYRFVQLCFERVLGREATQAETFRWSSLLASEGLRSFAEKLTESDEYQKAFGDYTVPYRRSLNLSPSDQGLPALPKELSVKRYYGEGLKNQYFPGLPFSGLPPEWLQKAGAVLIVAGCLELGRIFLTLAWGAVTSGSL